MVKAVISFTVDRGSTYSVNNISMLREHGILVFTNTIDLFSEPLVLSGSIRIGSEFWHTRVPVDGPPNSCAGFIQEPGKFYNNTLWK